MSIATIAITISLLLSFSPLFLAISFPYSASFYFVKDECAKEETCSLRKLYPTSISQKKTRLKFLLDP